MPMLRRTTVYAIAGLVAGTATALAQPSTKAMDLAGKLNCDQFKMQGNGSWMAADDAMVDGQSVKGKSFSKSSDMGVALAQKCTPKDKR